MALSGGATLTNGNSVNIFDNGTLTLDNTVTNQNYRLTAGVVGTGRSVTLNGNTAFNINGNSGAATLEDSGQLQFAQGNGLGGGTFPDTSGMGTVNLVSTGWTVQYTANSLNFSTGAALFRGTNLGTVAISPTGSNVSATTIAFNTAPGLSGGAFAANQNTPLVGIIKGAMGDSVIGGVDTYGLVTYDNTAGTGVGVRLLNNTEYLQPNPGGANTVSFTAATVANNNILLNQSANNGGTPYTVTGTLRCQLGNARRRHDGHRRDVAIEFEHLGGNRRRQQCSERHQPRFQQ